MTKITLFPWQNQALKNWIENKGQGIIQAPTGSGKTFLGLKLMEKEKLLPILIIVPTVELKSQWVNRVRKYHPERGVIGVGGGEKLRAFTPDITVAVINSIRKEKLSVKTLIIDEIHHSTVLAPINFQIWKNIETKYILGLSATPIPERLGSENTGWNIPLVYQYTLSQAYQDKVLLRPEIVVEPVELEENEQERYDKLTEMIRAKAGSFDRFESAPPWFKRWTFERNEVLFNSKRKLDKLRNILVDNNFKKCIIFTERIDTAREIVREINGLGIEGLALHSNLKKNERREAVSRFINNSHPVVLTTAHLFEEGMDVPETDLLILHSFNSTKRESLQRIGRSLHNHNSVPRVYILYYRNTKESYNARKIRRLFE